MSFYNKILSKILIAAIIANGCGALALVDEHHQMHEAQDRYAAVMPSQVLHEMPVPPIPQKATHKAIKVAVSRAVRS